ncbi:hypothetical protein EXIGLDRAFT_705635 [Exidia glandulosa HHB12029]|uniref:Uncharacterized protein n=1 Tax=Exidia glandulosa HHB12029 TaxID=1314781 RepID=A0A165BBA0_EXIGL|nr:hypothetical protein EXIGLDRAFT_705635 [Exidia glandulosa HHB12029]
MTVEPNNSDIQVDYDSPSILYSPAQEWRQSISGKDAYPPGTPIEITYNVSASVQFNFTGSHIWYYGDFHTDHGNCSIAIDHGNPVTVSTRYQYWLPVQRIWDADVTPGPHTLMIVNLNDQAPVTLAYLKFATTPASTAPIVPRTDCISRYRPLPATEHISPTANSPTASPPTATSPTASLSQGMPVATVVGLILGLIAVTICVVLIVGILFKRGRGPIDAKKWTTKAEHQPRREKFLYRVGGLRNDSVSTLSDVQSTA